LISKPSRPEQHLMASLLASLFIASCMPSENPIDFIGMTAKEVRDRYGSDVRVVYVQRGVSDPKAFSGDILLSPFSIRHRVPHREYAAFVYCQVSKGVIERCTPDEVDDPEDELLKWFPGKALEEIPVEFYVQLPPRPFLPGWVPINEYVGDLEGFNGLLYVNRGRYIHFLRFNNGRCNSLESEVGSN